MKLKKVFLTGVASLIISCPAMAAQQGEFAETVGQLKKSNVILTKAVVKLIKKQKDLENLIKQQKSLDGSVSNSSIRNLKAKIARLEKEVRDLKYNVSANTKEIAMFLAEDSRPATMVASSKYIENGYKKVINGNILPDKQNYSKSVKASTGTIYSSTPSIVIDNAAEISPSGTIDDYEIVTIEKNPTYVAKKTYHKKRTYHKKKRATKKRATKKRATKKRAKKIDIFDDNICLHYDCSQGYILDGKFVKGPKPE